MNYVLLLAGGSGQRMGGDIPKQFIEVDGRPIIMHTLMTLESHPLVDAVQIVCLPDWIDELNSRLAQFPVTKLRGVTAGRENRYLSTRAGMDALKNADDNDVIVVHDSVRPLVTAESLSSVIEVCRAKGNSMATVPCNDTMYERTEADCSARTVNRDKLVCGQTPEAVTGKRMREMYRLADERQIFSDSISALQLALGWKIHFAQGSSQNIKITRPEDLLIFKAIYNLRREAKD